MKKIIRGLGAGGLAVVMAFAALYCLGFWGFQADFKAKSAEAAEYGYGTVPLDPPEEQLKRELERERIVIRWLRAENAYLHTENSLLERKVNRLKEEKSLLLSFNDCLKLVEREKKKERKSADVPQCPALFAR